MTARRGEFASAISGLCFAYSDLEGKKLDLRIARGNRDVTQERAYAAMKVYREDAEAGSAAMFVERPMAIQIAA